MKKLPQRPRPHVLETESIMFVKQILPMEWIISERKTDYGIDLEVEVVEDSNVTGAHFLMQLKSTDKLIVNKKGYVSHSCKTSALQYYLERAESVVYLVYDSKANLGYWIWIQDFLNNQPSRNWRNQDEFTVKIPGENLFDKDSIEKIKKRILKSHKKEKLVKTIETLNHPGIRYGLKFSEDTTTVNVSYKYPGAEHDYPLSFGLTLSFDDSDEGKKARDSWESAFKKGTRAKINARFIKEFTTPKVLDILDNLSDEKFSLDELVVVPLRRDKRFKAKIEVFNKENNLVAQVPYLDFKEIRYGTDESLFSNREQLIPTEFSILIKFPERESIFSFKLNCSGFNVAQARDVLNIQKSLASGGWLQLVHLDTGITLLKKDFPENLVSKPLDVHVEIANDLTLIQQRMKVPFPWPDKISRGDYNLIKDIVSIITNGESFMGKHIGFSFDKVSAQKLAEAFSKSSYMKFIFDGEHKNILLFGQELKFGPTRVLVGRAKLTKKTLKRFSSLELLAYDAKIKIDLDVDEPGAIIQYLNWLPEKTIGE